MNNNTPIKITDDKSFKRVALEYYRNPQALSYKDFEQDVRMFNATSQAIEKYFGEQNTKISERLLLNKIIVIHNVFGRFTSYGLFYKTNTKHWRALKTMLSFLKILPLDCQQQQIDDDQNLITILNCL